MRSLIVSFQGEGTLAERRKQTRQRNLASLVRGVESSAPTAARECYGLEWFSLRNAFANSGTWVH